MRHYGDITKISGAAVEPVDVITGGSPCQDLSVGQDNATITTDGVATAIPAAMGEGGDGMNKSVSAVVRRLTPL